MQAETNDSPRACSLSHCAEAGIGRKGRRERGVVVGAGSMVELLQPGLGEVDVAFWQGI